MPRRLRKAREGGEERLNRPHFYMCTQLAHYQWKELPHQKNLNLAIS